MTRPLPNLLHADVTEILIGQFYRVYKDLGYGFREHVYRNAMEIALQGSGLKIDHEVPIRVHFEGKVIGKYQADLVANDVVLVELKACKALADEHEAQLLNYLKATVYEVGLLMNFGPKPYYRRMIYENCRKGSLSWIK